MDHIIVYDGGGAFSTCRVAGAAITFHCSRTAWRRLVCFCGGKRGARRVYDEYRAALHAIQIMKGIMQHDKRCLIEDQVPYPSVMARRTTRSTTLYLDQMTQKSASILV
jgi:hypothetical protein